MGVGARHDNYREKEFTVRGMNGFGITFREETEGFCQEAVFTQPGTVLVARRQSNIAKR